MIRLRLPPEEQLEYEAGLREAARAGRQPRVLAGMRRRELVVFGLEAVHVLLPTRRG